MTPARLPVSERHLSPYGRTILELMKDFDPRDVHEMQPFLLPRVTDAATGQVVLDLTNVLTSSRFEWDPDGALILRMSLPWDRSGNDPGSGLRSPRVLTRPTPTAGPRTRSAKRKRTSPI